MIESRHAGGVPTLTTGQEWLVDASGCAPERLKDAAALAALFEELIVLLSLKVVGQPQWHVFPEPGGITGLTLLAESHLTIHTFPEHGFAALNVYCCRTRARPDFESLLTRHLGAASCTVRELKRGGVA
ncbi:adenosylmethionine decarboxylase [Pyxidicoccus parkwayensis]|uniref:Adenosylmethionine decarboxylase n=1 Tax=Pyxidicoccus parkwayensis TaxID=2813578 RepID=A0ABX7NV83_9BACT|nr:adenosylmethionine decarboxylase [Pyxidicoccus parkwaysis]QSQ20033.1 adenosylmethionine decarboxylase [Pyxidicoccus parkwaysis]